MIEEFGIGSPLNPMTAQSANHRAALAKAEREEKLAEASRMLMNSSSPDPSADLRAMISLLGSLVKDPKAVAKHIEDLDAARVRSEQAVTAAGKATQALDRKEAAFNKTSAAREAEIERRSAEAEAKAQRRETELDRREHSIANRETQLAAKEKQVADKQADLQRRWSEIQRAVA